MPEAKLDTDIEAFRAITTALYSLPEESRERVLRAAAILIGFDFLEDERRRR